MWRLIKDKEIEMQVKRVVPSGYCKGVVSAIEIAKQTRALNPDAKIYILGMIVHNQYVTEALKEYSIVTLDDHNKTKEALIDMIDEGIVILTAHGTSEKLKAQALKKGLKIVDAACSDVIKTQTIIKTKLNEGYNVLYIGKKGHPEAEAVIAISERIFLVSAPEDLENLNIEGPLFVTNQTTMSIYDLHSLIDQILVRWPEAVVMEEICSATSMRQKAIMDLKDCDLLYVVGDSKSNNTNQLKNIALASGIKKVIMLDNNLMLDEKDLKSVENVYVTSGASTPTYLTRQVIECLNTYKETKKLPKLPIDIAKLLD